MVTVEEIPDSSVSLTRMPCTAHREPVYLLVIGLTGAGKSTFISRATGDDTIPTGASLFGVTQEVEEYVTTVDGVEVHLIDSPGFDDGGCTDHEVLDKISQCINAVYNEESIIGGIIHMYDITRTRLGGAGELNIRVLESMTGRDRWQHITLVTNKWHCSADPQGELQREEQLSSSMRAYGSMLEGDEPARMCRFMNTQESALDIIRWHLNQSFEPEIVLQMADPNGPGLELGSTDAGQVVAQSVLPKLRRQGDLAAQERFEDVLHHRFDQKQARYAIQGMITRLERAKQEERKEKMRQGIAKVGIVGGSVLCAVLLENPALLGAGWAATKMMDKKMQEKRAMMKEQVASMEEALLSLRSQPYDE